MTSIIDNLEDLTNDQLRLRLLEFGFANMPVTSTTRKVLIKKLRNAVDGEKAKSRRETIHVTKYSSDEESESNDVATAAAKKKSSIPVNRRATIGAAGGTPVPKPMSRPPSAEIIRFEKPAPASVKARRISARMTPTKEDGKIAPIQPSVPELIEESDEDIITVSVTKNRNKSRSPSLGKSDTITTSYKQTLSAFQPSNNDIIEIADDLENSSDAEVRAYTNSNNGQILSQAKTNISGGRLSSLKRTETDSESYSGIRNAYEPAVSSISRPLISTSYNRYEPNVYSSRPSTYQREFEEQDSEEDDQYTENITQKTKTIDSPYLSEFTRRLSRLKPEPLLGELRSDPNEVTSYRTSVAASSRRPLKNKDEHSDTIWSSFKELIAAFDQKFRSILISVFLLLLVIFIYVFFFTN